MRKSARGGEWQAGSGLSNTVRVIRGYLRLLLRPALCILSLAATSGRTCDATLTPAFPLSLLASAALSGVGDSSTSESNLPSPLMLDPITRKHAAWWDEATQAACEEHLLRCAREAGAGGSLTEAEAAAEAFRLGVKLCSWASDLSYAALLAAVVVVSEWCHRVEKLNPKMEGGGLLAPTIRVTDPGAACSFSGQVHCIDVAVADDGEDGFREFQKRAVGMAVEKLAAIANQGFSHRFFLFHALLSHSCNIFIGP